ncbi:MAG TPA: hypothetical protein EYH31_09070 [Anaerolineae bacterium]|nr:hypothetical protein [Anaerolineae bacterium]
MSERMFVYSGMLTRQYRMKVVSVVIYLHRRLADVPGVYEVTLGNRVVNRYEYQVVKLWEYEDAIRRGELRSLAPLLVMLTKEPDEQDLWLERTLILQEEDVHKRANLLASVGQLRHGTLRKGSCGSFSERR